MTLSTDTEKDFNKIQHPVMMKAFQKVNVKETSQQYKSYIWQNHS